MGIFFAYTIYSGVFLLFLFLFYKVLISNEKQILLNRILLLSCYALAFAAWPLSQIEWRRGGIATTTLVGIEMPMMQDVGVGEGTQSKILMILIWIYIVGASAVLLNSLFSVAKIILYLRKGTLHRRKGYTLIVMPDNETAPFSIGRYIVLSASDYKSINDAVIAHEAAHIKCRHYLDLILAQIVCIVLWYNPASWLMRDELKLLHEYQADDEVLESGVDPTVYQMLLIRKTVGNRFQTLANSLNHSKLKNRIAMMQKEKSGGFRRMRVLALAIAPMVAFGVMNLPAVASDLKGLEDISLTEDLKEVMKKENVKGSKKYSNEPLKLDGNLMLFVGPCADVEHGDDSNQVVMVNGKRLTEQIELNTEDIETLVNYPPSTEFPGGLVDIRLKKK